MLARLCHRWLALASSSVTSEALQPQTYTSQKCGFRLNAADWFFRKKPPASFDPKGPRKPSSEPKDGKPEEKEDTGQKLVRGKPFKIVPATTDDRDEILKLLKMSFYASEPLMMSLGLVGARVPPEFDDYFLVDLCESCLMDDVRGFSINSTLTKYRKPIDPEMLRSVGPCGRMLLRIWEFLEVTSNLPECFGESKIFEIRYLATHPDYLRKGIALHLTKESLILAKAKGYKIACMFATSIFSKKVAENAGMHVVWAMPWSEFKDGHGDQIVNARQPHTHAYVLAKDLGPFDKRKLICT